MRLVQRVLVERQVHFHDVRRAEQPVGVIAEAEDGRPLLGLVGAQALEDAAAVVQGVGQDVDLGLAPGQPLAVQPDDAVSVIHRHGVFSESV